MRPYSQDLRERIIAAVERGEASLREIAELFLVNVSTVGRLVKRRRQTGSVEPSPHRGGRRPALDDGDLERLKELVRERTDATLKELRDGLGIDCGIMAVARALERLKITRKKKVLHDAERDTPEERERRRTFREEVGAIDPNRLVFVDETGTNTSMTRTHGRASKGERVEGAIPRTWSTLTLICGLRLSGAIAPFVFPGATDNAAFETYAKQVLAPRLRPGDATASRRRCDLG